VEDIERQAGIKLTRIGIPQPEDVIRASSKEILKNLEQVNHTVLPLFAETATKLIEQQADPHKALCMALAYISGHYKQALTTRSLITGQENQLTIKMTNTQGQTLNTTACYSILRKYWEPRVAEQVRQMRGIQGGMGTVFDVYEDKFDRFMENFHFLKERDGERIDFIIERCSDLPELAEDDGGDAWRMGGGGGFNNNNGGGGFNGGGGY